MSRHSRAAIHLAEILIPKPSARLPTTYGAKSRETLADLIDRETAVPELLEAVRLLTSELAMWPGDKNPEYFPGMKLGRQLLKDLTGDDSTRKPKETA